MLNVKPTIRALYYIALSFFIMPSLASANDDYTILPCNACSDYSMQKKAQTLALYKAQKVHVYNVATGELKAYMVEKGVDSGTDSVQVTQPDELAVQRAAAVHAANNVVEPQVPDGIATSAWEYARFSAIQNKTRDALQNNATWQEQSIAKAQALIHLFQGDFQPLSFVTHLISGGKLGFKSDGFLIGNEITLHLVFDYAEDKDGNIVPQTKKQLFKRYHLSKDTAKRLASVARNYYGFSTVKFSGEPAPDSASYFSCSQGDSEITLNCTELVSWID